MLSLFLNFKNMSLSQKILMGSLGIVTTTSTLSTYLEKEMRNYDMDTVEPVDSVSIIVPTYNEEQFVKRALSSIRKQSVIDEFPDMIELILVDSGSTDNTVEIAKNYVDKVIIAEKRGKLSARNLATSQSKGNILVAVDADTIYSYYWLNSLLKPFQDPDVVAVVGSSFDYTMTSVPGQLFSLANYIDKKILYPYKMAGRNSAYWKHIDRLIGGFNEDIYQLNQKELQQEEEYMFGRRLLDYSRLNYNNQKKIVFQLSASCWHLGGEKGSCRMGMNSKDVCDRYGIGISRF